MARRVTDLDGRVWDVSIDWIGKHLCWRGRIRFGRRREDERRQSERDGWNVLELLDVPASFDEISVFLVILVVVVLLGVLLVTAPWWLAALVDLIELVVLLPIAIGLLGWRTLRGQPWTVKAVSSSGQVMERTVDSYRAARRELKSLSTELAASHPRIVTDDQRE